MMERGQGENLKRARTGPESLGASVRDMVNSFGDASSTRPERRAQPKKTIIIIDFLFSYSAEKKSRKLLWNSTRPLRKLEFRPFRKQWKFRLRRWDVKIE